MRTIILFFLATLGVLAQEYELTGIVTDTQKEVLVGAFVVIKGTKQGVQTDFDGKYAIKVKPNDVLQFSYIGFKTKEIVIKGQKTLNVVLEEDSAQLEEVVVTGYAPVYKKSYVSASVSKVSKRGLFSRDSSKSKIRGKRAVYDEESSETYASMEENAFKKASTDPVSTFSADVDRASYSNVRRFLRNGQFPDEDAVRIEEMINYFEYQYPEPKGDTKHPFALTTQLSRAPWKTENYLLQIGLQTKKIDLEKAPPSNIVFLIDVSGSMDEPNKLPLLKESFKMLLQSLRPKDRVAIVVYAGASGVVLSSTFVKEKDKIEQALDELEAGGSTAGGEGLQLAYKVAREHFIEGGNNRIILATDGDFNVGINNRDDLKRLIEKERESGIYISVLGFGMGNYRDDMVETIANKGNGNYAYIDDIMEARKVLVKEFGGTLFTVAKDVKLQMEFNPKYVKRYRLVGYENRMLNTEDFEDDKKDAGEIGAGHTVTVFYEIEPANGKAEKDLRYQTSALDNTGGKGNEIAFLKMRYKEPDSKSEKSIETSMPIAFAEKNFEYTSDDFRFAVAVAEFGMLLRSSKFKEKATYQQVIDIAKKSVGNDPEGYRKEFIRLVESAKLLAKKK